eukprot:TRINITY_DN2056_c0_g1::TRINITY_DN2056_c0_g1_i1::g.21770::m.21770 TRINITY_DN2056_c0_g1::TRINITY_DN2056_c0_g1_i1::g.21770  ORF type:complete len:381 (+),score=127.58,sp/P45693/SP5S_BACSU/32.91/9e-06,SpoVS/PF04232.7/3.4e-11,SpoVS/PF04232.7/2.5e-20,MIP-T3/PF10243.4/0.0051,TFIIA/PF03153.8/13 TRINITY_DN2056_c0_g1_i1:95-1144(+)
MASESQAATQSPKKERSPRPARQEKKTDQPAAETTSTPSKPANTDNATPADNQQRNNNSRQRRNKKPEGENQAAPAPQQENGDAPKAPSRPRNRRRGPRNAAAPAEGDAENTDAPQTENKTDRAPRNRRRNNTRGQKRPLPEGEPREVSDEKQSDSTGKVKVGAETASTRLAGMMANLVRQGESDKRRFVAVGAAANNQAVKGVVIARRYLAQDAKDGATTPSDIAFRLAFVRLEGFSEGGRGIEYSLEHVTDAEPVTGKNSDLKVSKSTQVRALAGAIAAGIRQNEQVSVQGVGPFSVNQAIKSITLAQSYLRRDGFRLAVRPDFVDITLSEERKSTGVKLNLVAIKL